MDKKTKTGWPIPISVKELFVNFCDEKGNIKQEDCAGALFVWQYLPAQIRESARLEAKGIPVDDKQFWENFRKSILFSSQKPYSLSEDQIKNLWIAVEKIAKKVGVKITKPKAKS